MFFPLSFNKNQTLVSFPGSSDGKESACNVGDMGSILGWEDSLEKETATHSNILAWRIPTDKEAWWALAHGVAESRTWLSDFHPLKHLWNKWSFGMCAGVSINLLLSNNDL